MITIFICHSFNNDNQDNNILLNDIHFVVNVCLVTLNIKLPSFNDLTVVQISNNNH